MKDDFRDAIVFFLNLRNSTSLRASDIAWTSKLLEDGYLDSLGVYDLFIFLEQKFRIEVPLDRLVLDFPSTLEDLYFAVISHDSK